MSLTESLAVLTVLFREAEGLTQSELGRAIGFSQPWVCKFEDGLGLLPADALPAWLWTFEELLTDEEILELLVYRGDE